MDDSIETPIFIKNKSGKRDSNPRPSAWEAKALPTELLPHFYEEFPIANVIVILHINKLSTQFYD